MIHFDSPVFQAPAMCMNQIYSLRATRAWSRLSQEHFEASTDEALFFIGSGCLDAPEEIPGGSMQGFGKSSATAFTSPNYIYRSALATDEAVRRKRQQLATKLVQQVMQELAAEGVA